MYTVKADATTRIIETSLGGFLDTSEVDDYIKEVQSVLIANQLFRAYKMLIDASKCSIQSQENLARFKKHMDTMPKSDRLAIIVGNTIAFGQVRRLFTQPYARIVSNRNEAIAWLLQE